MNAVMRHRGPDDEGLWTGGHVGLGHVRLAIVDLSPTGRQPMTNEDGTIWISFNGEIYNHAALRDDLLARGHRYRGASDTETIIHLYEEYGSEGVARLHGMFAFAIWDARRGRLLLARDRFGKKPLFFAETEEGLTFGSEIKAVLQDPEVPTDADDTALYHYLTYGYVPGPQTAFKAIRKLPPGSTLVWEGGRVTEHRYWQLGYAPKLAIAEEEAAREVFRLLREATADRLMSDVALGAFLSGGIDSSAVVALMTQASGDRVKTFSVGFDEATFDETRYARLVAERYETEHHEFIVTPDALATLPALVWAYGEPYADSSALATFYIARETRRHVTVALNGDGGDEIFAGYDRYLAARLSARYQKLPAGLRSLLAQATSHLHESTTRKGLAKRVKRFVSALEESPARRYGRWVSFWDDTAKALLCTQEFHSRVAHVDSLALLEPRYERADTRDPAERAQAMDVETYLPDDLLVKADVATMANSLEGRSPFLDHRVAEFAARLPADQKLRGRQTKCVLRQAMRPHLPEAVLHRGKQGFGVPMGAWFRGQLRSFAQDVLLDRQTRERGLLDPVAVGQLLEEHLSGRADHGERIWQLLWLEVWFRTYVDRPRAELTGPLDMASLGSLQPHAVAGRRR